MDSSKKKAFQIKIKSMQRTLKEYLAYKNQFQAYDINEVSQSKKKTEFYQESKLALEQVQKNLIDFCLQLNSFIQQNKEQIESDELVKEDYLKAQSKLSEVKALFPASF